MLKNIGIKLLSGFGKHLETNPSALYHTSPALLKCDIWKSYNDKIYPPQKPEDPPRGAFVVHVKEDIRYQYKKMWHIAHFIRGMTIDEALKQLLFVPRKGSLIVRDTLLEAQELAVREHNVEFKSNLWVSESFVGKSFRIKGLRRHAKGRVGHVNYTFIHYFVCLEEGTPPKYYNHWRKPRTGEEMLEKYITKLRERRISYSI